MRNEAVELRNEAKKCRELARAALVQSSKDALLKTALEFDEAADQIEFGGNLSITQLGLEGLRRRK